MILNYVVPDNMNGYLLYAYPYGILLTTSRGRKWIANHYVCGFSYINDDNDINVEYLDGISYGKFSVSNNMIHMESHKDIKPDLLNKFVMNAIDQHEYVIVFLDEYYRRDSVIYGRYHLLHEILIYGYDDGFLYVAFDKNEHLSNLKIGFDELVRAYSAGYEIDPTKTACWIKEKRIVCCKIDFDHEDKEITYIGDYYRGGQKLIIDDYTERQYCAYVGVSSVELFIDVLIKQKDKYRKMIPYAGIHALYEAKLHVAKYWKDRDDCIYDFYVKEIIPLYNTARMLYIKERLCKKTVWNDILMIYTKANELEKKIADSYWNILL